MEEKCPFLEERECWSGCYRGDIFLYCNVFSTGSRPADYYGQCNGDVSKCTRKKAYERRMKTKGEYQNILEKEIYVLFHI